KKTLGFIFLITAAILVGIVVEEQRRTSKIPIPVVPAHESATTTAQTTPPDNTEITLWKTTLNQRLEAPYLFPNQFDHGINDLVLGNATPTHLLSIPEHTSEKIVRVYLVQPQIAGQLPFSCQNMKLCVVEYDPSDKSSTLIGAIDLESGAQSGAYYLPLAVTPDDKHLVLDAWMQSPGLGGGAIDYGFSLLPLTPANPNHVNLGDPALTNTIASRSAQFYNAFSKVVWLDNSDQTPAYSQPGPQSNDGAVLFRNLINGQTSTLLSEPDTTYKFLAFHEKGKKLEIEVTKYSYTKACPRAEDALLCAHQTTSTQTITLP
ncbi:MAG TPA: hypothetical protein VFQ60_05610, partial [Patescibacteria group bacterium]|nr:hypothetical protein [Patescibacteria group bacterium]